MKARGKMDFEIFDKLVETNKNKDLFPKLYEELIEFKEAVDDFKKEVNSETHLNAISECADVYIVARQLGLLNGVPYEASYLNAFMSTELWDRFIEFKGSETFNSIVNYKMARTILKDVHGDYNHMIKKEA